MTTAITPATDPTTVAMMVILLSDKPPLEGGPSVDVDVDVDVDLDVDVEVGAGCPASPVLPGVAVAVTGCQYVTGMKLLIMMKYLGLWVCSLLKLS